jgi:hypothetical protein
VTCQDTGYLTIVPPLPDPVNIQVIGYHLFLEDHSSILRRNRSLCGMMSRERAARQKPFAQVCAKCTSTGFWRQACLPPDAKCWRPIVVDQPEEGEPEKLVELEQFVARAKRMEAALRTIAQSSKGHHDTCSHALHWEYECDCYISVAKLVLDE